MYSDRRRPPQYSSAHPRPEGTHHNHSVPPSWGCSRPWRRTTLQASNGIAHPPPCRVQQVYARSCSGIYSTTWKREGIATECRERRAENTSRRKPWEDNAERALSSSSCRMKRSDSWKWGIQRTATLLSYKRFTSSWRNVHCSYRDCSSFIWIPSSMPILLLRYLQFSYK